VRYRRDLGRSICASIGVVRQQRGPLSGPDAIRAPRRQGLTGGELEPERLIKWPNRNGSVQRELRESCPAWAESYCHSDELMPSGWTLDRGCGPVVIGCEPGTPVRNPLPRRPIRAPTFNSCATRMGAGRRSEGASAASTSQSRCGASTCIRCNSHWFFADKRHYVNLNPSYCIR
jgi:hypothetical protein